MRYVLLVFIAASFLMPALPVYGEKLENEVIEITYIRFGVKDWQILRDLNGPYTVHVLCKKEGTAIVRQTIYKDRKPYKTNSVSESCPRQGEVIIMEFEIIDVKKGFSDSFDLPPE